MHVSVKLSVHICSSYFFKISAIEDQDETRLTRYTVDDGDQDDSYK